MATRRRLCRCNIEFIDTAFEGGDPLSPAFIVRVMFISHGQDYSFQLGLSWLYLDRSNCLNTAGIGSHLSHVISRAACE